MQGEERGEGYHISKRQRRNHAPAFKAKQTLEVFKVNQPIVELSQLLQALKDMLRASHSTTVR